MDVVEYGPRRALIVVGVMLAALLQTLDATIVNVALPTIEGNLGASIDEGTWIITGYMVSNVVAIPLAPWLMTRFGRRRYFAACIIGFTIASALCGTAGSLPALVLYRVIQGAFGGGLIATSQVVLRDTFPAAQTGASAALFAIALTVGPALGPTVGGILTDNLSWQWVFDINLLPGALAAWIIATMLRDPARARRIPFDAAGVTLLALALGALQYVLNEGERRDWLDDRGIAVAAAAAVLAGVAFVAFELRARSPIVDLRVFRHRNVRAGVPAAVLLGAVIFGPVVLLPQYVQNLLGFTATQSGLLIFLRAAPVVVLTPLVARFAARADARWVLTIGFTLSAVGVLLLQSRMTTQSDFGTFVLPLLVSGVGQSMLLVPLLITIQSDVPAADAAKSSSFISLSVQLGGSIMSTLVITIFDRREFFHADVLRSAVTNANPALAPLLHLPGALARISSVVSQQAANLAFADALLILAPVCAITLIPIWLLRRRAVTGAAPIAAE